MKNKINQVTSSHLNCLKIVPVLLLMGTMALICPTSSSAFDDSEREFLNRVGGTYRGNFVINLSGDLGTGTEVVPARLRLPRGEGRARIIYTIGSSELLTASIVRVKVRKQRVQYKGAAIATVDGISVSGTFLANATLRGSSREQVRSRWTLTGAAFGGSATLKGTFEATK